jgi:DNA excision repair protein ERCC-4
MPKGRPSDPTKPDTSGRQKGTAKCKCDPKPDDPTDIDCNKPIVCPFTVIIDTREQAPYQFRTFKADAKHKTQTGISKDLYIPVEIATLKTADYSIKGFESEIAIERKSLMDLFGTLGSGRERFERELERLSKLQVAHVVIEASWETVLQKPPERTKLSPKSVFRSINAWEQEFPTIHWQFMGMEAIAEHKTFRILERFWNQKQRAIEKENPQSGVTSM